MSNFAIASTTKESISEIMEEAFIESPMLNRFNSISPHIALLCLSISLAWFAACNRRISERGAPNSSTTKHYSFKGKVVSLDKLAGAANVDNEPISGYMDQMTMAYAIKPPAMFEQLQPGDSITADLIVEPDNKYWLENVKVTGHSQTPADRPAGNADKDKGNK
jgi:Cu/Ag efflux protein CusF